MPDPLTHPLTVKLRAAWPPEDWADVTTLVAVSGGPDSMALLDALATPRQIGPGRLVVAHFDHRWRPQSQDEQQFVRQVAQQRGLECVAGHAPDDCPATEETARAARYRFLSEASARVGARYLATGHTADDQAETILHRILRGTGIAGLAGIRPSRQLNPAVTLVRPLLAVSRSEVLDYLDQHGVAYCTDATNADLRFTRNRLRHELLPHLAEEYNPEISAALVRLGQTARQIQAALRPTVEGLFEQSAVAVEATRLELRLAPLAGQAEFLLREVLVLAWRRQGWPEQAMSHAHWQTLVDLIAADQPAVDLPGAIHAQRAGDRLVLCSR